MRERLSRASISPKNRPTLKAAADRTGGRPQSFGLPAAPGLSTPHRFVGGDSSNPTIPPSRKVPPAAASLGSEASEPSPSMGRRASGSGLKTIDTTQAATSAIVAIATPRSIGTTARHAATAPHSRRGLSEGSCSPLRPWLQPECRHGAAPAGTTVGLGTRFARMHQAGSPTPLQPLQLGRHRRLPTDPTTGVIVETVNKGIA